VGVVRRRRGRDFVDRRRDQRVGTLGAGGVSARVYDELQFTLGGGPCLDSVAPARRWWWSIWPIPMWFGGRRMGR
jgi:hypothetical protein